MKSINLSMVAIAAFLVSSALHAEEPKATLMGNYNIKYNKLPSSVDSISEMFSEGMVYGRLRANFFRWDYEHRKEDHTALGLGGSMVYKTAKLNGVSATVGANYTKSPFSDVRGNKDEVSWIRSGKDTISRDRVKRDGKWDMAVVSQAYLQYDLSKTSFKLGRQLFESALTASNDTKMIPNTFDGVSVESNDIPKTNIKAAVFNKQMLRDHVSTHDVLTFSDGNGNNWNGNDDNGVHKGLSYANFKARGEDTSHKLIVAAISNQSIKNLKLDLTYTAVPDVVSTLIGEVNYKIDLGDAGALTPGVRYIKQFDDGGGKVGGAALSGKLANSGADLGYKRNDTLDTSLYMARLVYNYDALQLLAGYSKTQDKADIVAPWRGFPTGGYTRAMAQLNWVADTKAYMGEVSYDFGKAKLVDGFKAMGRYVVQDFDEAKQAAGVQSDSKVIHIDLIKKITPSLEGRARFASARFKDRVAGDHVGEDMDSYFEYRFELNYLF